MKKHSKSHAKLSNNSISFTSKRILVLLVLSSVFLSAHADSNWIGFGSTDNWTSSANWVGGVPDTSPIENVIFCNVVCGPSTLDRDWILGSITVGSLGINTTWNVQNNAVLTLHERITYNFPGNLAAPDDPRFLGQFFFPITLGNNVEIETTSDSLDNPDNTVTFFGGINTNGHTLSLRPFGADIIVDSQITGPGQLEIDGNPFIPSRAVRLTKENTYTGLTTVRNGSLITSGEGRIPDSSDLSVFGNSSFLLRLDINSEDAINGLYGDGNVSIGLANTLVIGNSANTSSGNGYFSGFLSGVVGNLSKRGQLGTQILDGPIDHPRVINIEEGTLVFGSSSSFIRRPDIVVHPGATLEIQNNETYDPIVNSGGTINISGNVSTTSIQNLQGGEVILNGGSSLAIDLVSGGVLNNLGGVLSPGNSPGRTLITGDYQQGNLGSLLIELAGITPETEYDVLEVGGTATLDGILDVVLFGGYNPSGGETFDILAADSIVGMFSQVNFPTIQGILWELQTLVDEINNTDVIRLTAIAQPVPLPAAVWLFLTSLGFLVLTGKKL